MEENLNPGLNMAKDGEIALGEIPILTLAYLGDAVYEIMVRSYILDHRTKVAQLHRKSAGMVKAQAQAQGVKKIEDLLTDQEKDYLRRGRNAHPKTRAKNASMNDYRLATGFESLWGYLYLTGQENRLRELFQRMWEENEG